MNTKNRYLKFGITFLLFSMLSIAFSIVSSSGSKKKESIKLKVAAYNVLYSKLATAKEFGEKLKPYNFDIVCFSEAPGGNWTAEVGKAMGLDHVIVGRYSTAGHEDKLKTIASRTPLTNYEEVWMADTLHTVTRATTVIEDQVFAVYSDHKPVWALLEIK